MIVGRSRLMDWVDLNENPFWKVKNHDSTALIAENDPTVDDFTTSRIRLTSVLDSLGNGRFNLETRNLADQKKNILKTGFEIPQTESAPGVQQNGLIAGQDITTLVTAQVGQQMREFRSEQEIKELKREISEMKREGFGAADRIMMNLEPAIPAIVGKMFDVEVPPVSGVNGTGQAAPTVSGHTNDPKAQEAFDAQMKAFTDGLLLESEGGKKVTEEETARAMAFGAAKNIDPKFQAKAETGKATEAEAAELTEALEIIRKKEGDEAFLDIMKKLSVMATEDEATWTVAKAMLNNPKPA